MIIEKNTNKSPFFDICKEYNTVKLICNDGFSVILCSVGASIRQILFPTSDSVLKNIALAFEQDSAYFGNSLYAGATLAPCAGRISHGKLPINDKVYSLSLNENNTNTLHGGFHNASFKNWKLVSAEVNNDISDIDAETEIKADIDVNIHGSSETAVVVFRLTLEDGLDGFPGNRELKAIYMLKEDHTLTLKYEAVSDKDTYFNISNHTYFNLTGDFSKSALGHKLQIQADQYILNTPEFIPEGISKVDGTPFDLRQSAVLQEQVKAHPNNVQIERNQGYNHEYILNHNLSAISPTAPAADSKPDLICTSPDGSLELQISSDSPCVVVYSGGYFETGIELKEGQTTSPDCALAFEFQDYLDAPNGHGFPYNIVHAGEIWQRNICYRFLKCS